MGGNSFGVPSLGETALQPVVECEWCSRPCVLLFGTDLIFCFLCLQVAGDADSLSEDKQAESEEEEEGRAPNSPGNPRGTHNVSQSLASFSGPWHCSAPGEYPPKPSGVADCWPSDAACAEGESWGEPEQQDSVN